MATYKSIKYIIPTEAVEHTDSINALADVDTTTVAPSVGQTLKWSAANSRWQPADIEEVASSGIQKAIFGFGVTLSADGWTSSVTNATNLVSSSGVVASDTTGVGTARYSLAAASYGGDKAIFGFGLTTNITNLVSNIGVVATDSTGVGTARYAVGATGYGDDKAIFGFGYTNSTYQNMTNLVSSSGVVSSDTTGVGSVRYNPGAARFGSTGQAIFAFGSGSSYNFNASNLVSNVGVVGSDVTGVGTYRTNLASAEYGGDKAIFGYGDPRTSITNLVSNTGVVASDTTGVGTARQRLAAAGYGGDKAIFGFGFAEINYTYNGYNMTNLVSNTGVVASDTTNASGVTNKSQCAAASFSLTA